MGLDCRIVAIPRHPKNEAVGLSPSPFLSHQTTIYLPDAWAQFDGHSEDEPVSFYKDVYYCRKNWYLFRWVVERKSIQLKTVGIEDANGVYIQLDAEDLNDYVKLLKSIAKSDFYDETEDIYTTIDKEIYRMSHLVVSMDLYKDYFDFYFEGDY